MFSKEESRKLTSEFWTAFGKSFPRKWILYDTKIRDFSFKFFADSRCAQVSLDIEMHDDALRHSYFGRMLGLEDILAEAVGPYHAEEDFTLANGKTVSRIWVEARGVSIFNKDSWRTIFEFFVEKMDGLEKVFTEYEDYIKSVNPA